MEENLATAYADGIVTEGELLDILSDEPIVARTGANLFSVSTCTYFITDTFGMGKVETAMGSCPI